MAIVNSRVEGIDVVLEKLNIEIMKLKGNVIGGMLEAAIHIRRETEKMGNIMTPVDLGNLRVSWYVVSSKGLQADPIGVSGQFKNRPFKKMQIKASQMKAEHASEISNARAAVSANKDMVILGYSANYAIFVHENMNAVFQQKDGRTAGAKWFEAALRNNQTKILEIIKKKAAETL